MSFELQGTERTAGYGYQFEVICARPDGIPVAPDGTRIRFELRPGAARYRGYSRSLTMSDGQLQLITGIVAGSTCQVAETSPMSTTTR